MEHCIWCGKKSFGFSVNNYGLCNLCSVMMPQDIKAKFGFIKENKRIIEKINDCDTIVSLTIISLFQLRHLLDKEKNNELITQPIHNFIIRMVQTSNEKLLSLLADEFRMIKIRTKNLINEKNMECAYNKFIAKSISLKSYILDDDLPWIDNMISELRIMRQPVIKIKQNLVLSWFFSKLHAFRFYSYRELESNAVGKS